MRADIGLLGWMYLKGDITAGQYVGITALFFVIGMIIYLIIIKFLNS